MEILLDLNSGLKIARVQIDELTEQDVNAREMNKKMFERLVGNIRKDGRLESLPFCAQTDKGIEIVSGHHRIRAARSAGITEIFIVLDDTGMNKNRLRSKQLSHNSLQGEDNQQIIKQIYDMIEDAEEKLAAFVDSSIDITYDKAKIEDVSIDLDIKTVLVTFLTYEADVFKRAAEKINGKYDELYLADMKYAELFQEAVRRVGGEYDIRAMSTMLYKMSEIVLSYMGEEMPEDERVPLRDIFGAAYIPYDASVVVRAALDKMKKDGNITGKNKWQAIEYWAADTLAGATGG